MRSYSLYLLILTLALFACEKKIENDPEFCQVHNLAYTATSVIGNKEYVNRKVNSTYTYDSNNRLVQVRIDNLVSPSSANATIGTYSYDAQDRLVEIKHEDSSNPDNAMFYVYQYNEEGQMITCTVYNQYSSNGLKHEAGRYEYTYTSSQELRSSDYIVDNLLNETREYLYTNGLMTNVKVYPSGLPWESKYSYEIDIRYDDKKTPFEFFPAIVASRPGIGYPYQHNIISHTARYSNGLINDLHTYTKEYTYSEHGYPLTEQKIYNDNSIQSIENYNYTYICR